MNETHILPKQFANDLVLAFPVGISLPAVRQAVALMTLWSHDGDMQAAARQLEISESRLRQLLGRRIVVRPGCRQLRRRTRR